MISDTSFVVLRNVTDALVNFGSAAEVLVTERLKEDDNYVRANCCKILAQIGTKTSLKALIPLLSDAGGEVRSLCEEAVARIEETSEIA